MTLALYPRAWSITVGTLDVSGLAVEFSVHRTLKKEPNTAEIVIYNLNADSRARIEALDRVPVRVEAGYDAGASEILLGFLRKAWSVKSGPTWETHVQSGDGENLIAKKTISKGYAKGTRVSDVVSDLVEALEVESSDALDQAIASATLGPDFPQGTVVEGHAADELDEILSAANLEWSIQNGKLQVLPRGEPLGGRAIRLTPDTGLEGSPSVDSKGVLTAVARLIPGLDPGRTVVVDCEAVKGQFRIETSDYRGHTHGGDWHVAISGKAY